MSFDLRIPLLFLSIFSISLLHSFSLSSLLSSSSAFKNNDLEKRRLVLEEMESISRLSWEHSFAYPPYIHLWPWDGEQSTNSKTLEISIWCVQGPESFQPLRVAWSPYQGSSNGDFSQGIYFLYNKLKYLVVWNNNHFIIFQYFVGQKFGSSQSGDSSAPPSLWRCFWMSICISWLNQADNPSQWPE